MEEEPRKAATVILLKDSEAGLKVLMVRRNPKARALPGVWVFPGGAVDGNERATGDHDLRYRQTALRELKEETGIDLQDVSELVPYSHWVTPMELELRYDVHFYMARAPAQCQPVPDGHEVVEARWITPTEALEQLSCDQMAMIFPTIKHLEVLAQFNTCAEVIAAAPKPPLRTIQPRAVERDGRVEIVLPDEK